MRKGIKWLLGTGIVYLLLVVVMGVIVGEGSVHLYHRPLRDRTEADQLVRQSYNAGLQNISITAQDGVVLKAWYVHPQNSNGSVVILLHGIGDNREGVAGYGKLFLDHGYAVLLPDARGHGESGGDLATYGIKESDDVHRWVDWLYTRDLAPDRCVYGFGESYGAALILQSLAVESRYCAVAVESPFSTAREMSFERLSGFLHLGPWFGRSIGRPIIATAVSYTRWRYGIDLLQPSPLGAIENSKVPVLLIHGERDHSISPRHSLILARSAPGHVQLWLVPNAGHTMAWAAAGQEFESRILGWFSIHARSGPAQPKAVVQ